MKFNVTFQSTIAIEYENYPLGKELAQCLTQRLRQKGIEVSEVGSHQDFAWSITTGLAGRGPYLLLGFIGDGVYQWLIQIHSGIGWFGRIAGKSDLVLREKVARELQRILVSEPIFSDIRWHEAAFGDTGWSEAPEVEG